MKKFFNVLPILGYFFRGRDDERPKNRELRAMHWINRIAIIVFLAGIIYLIYKHW